MGRERRRVGRLLVDALTFQEALDRIAELARAEESSYVVTPNADHVVRAEKDDEFVRISNAAALSCADGQPLVWMSRLGAGPRLPERVAGSDLMPALAGVAAREGLPIFILGGGRGEAELCAMRLKEDHPALVVAGVRYPPFGFDKDEKESRSIVDQINASGARLIFVGVGSPKQERWIARWQPHLRRGVLLGIGISIAFCAATVRRAPVWMRKLGLEWLFRLAQEPSRLARRYWDDRAFFRIAWQTRQDDGSSTRAT